MQTAVRIGDLSRLSRCCHWKCRALTQRRHLAGGPRKPSQVHNTTPNCRCNLPCHQSRAVSAGTSTAALAVQTRGLPTFKRPHVIPLATESRSVKSESLNTYEHSKMCNGFLRLWFRIAALVWLVAATVPLVVPRVSALGLTQKRQGFKKLVAAHKSAQKYVESALGDEARMEDMLCALPAFAGFVSKNSSVHLSPTMKDRSGVQTFIRYGIPIFDSCQVGILVNSTTYS